MTVTIQSGVYYEHGLFDNGVMLNLTVDDPDELLRRGSVLMPTRVKDHILKVKTVMGGVTTVECWCWKCSEEFEIKKGDIYNVTK